VCCKLGVVTIASRHHPINEHPTLELRMRADVFVKSAGTRIPTRNEADEIRQLNESEQFEKLRFRVQKIMKERNN
jgi:hypothetical protein